MDERLEKLLVERYPEIFVDYKGDPMQTCMAWGMECQEGWFDIIDQCCSIIQNNYKNALDNYRWKLERYNKSEEEVAKESEKYPHLNIQPLKEKPEKPEEPYQTTASQIKEKYGTLRFYTSGASDADDGAIDMAESMSCKICEICGNPARVTGVGWFSCRCQRCEDISASDAEPEEKLRQFNEAAEAYIQRILDGDARRKKRALEGWAM